VADEWPTGFIGRSALFVGGWLMTLISNTYCTEADIQRLFSAGGVTSFADHDSDGIADTGVVDDCINHASQEIELYCRRRYSTTGLAACSLVNRWTTVLATAYLCERRGNPVPESLAKEATRILEELLPKVASGELSLPGIEYAADMRPMHSNLTIDRRYPYSKIRVITANSSDARTVISRDKVSESGVIYEQ